MYYKYINTKFGMFVGIHVITRTGMSWTLGQFSGINYASSNCLEYRVVDICFV